MICIFIGFFGALIGIVLVNWISPWWYREQIRRLLDENDLLRKKVADLSELLKANP